MLRSCLKTTTLASMIALSSLWAYLYDVTESQVWGGNPKAIAKKIGPGNAGPQESQYRKKILDAGPVGFWRLGEAKGPTAKDETKHAFHGVYHGKPIFGQPGAIHDINTAVGFHDNNSYVEVPANKAFSQPTSGKGMTVEVWMRPDTLNFKGETDDPYVFWLGKGMPGQQEWALRFYTKNSTRPNRISAYIFNKAGGLGAGAYFQDDIKPKQWIHVVATYDPGNKNNPKAGVSIYKNGVFRGGPGNQKGSLYSAYDIMPEAGTAPLRFGTRDLNSFLVGGLDEVAIYPRVLTTAEILDHYKTGVAKAK